MSRSTFSAAYTNASDATYTAWAYGLSQALDACGFFPKTADTGQVDWTPDRPAPSGINTFPDFEIRYLNDALHSTQPLYVKMEYGEAAVTNMPGMRVTFSLFPTNGAGSFTNGVSYGPYSIGPSAGAISASSFNSYVSGGEGYVNFCLFPGVTGNNGTALSISRLVNSAGAFTADGFGHLRTANADVVAISDWKRELHGMKNLVTAHNVVSVVWHGSAGAVRAVFLNDDFHSAVCEIDGIPTCIECRNDKTCRSVWNNCK